MEIRLSDPDLYFDKRVEQAAKNAGCFARIKWSEAWKVRFVLSHAWNDEAPASYAAHDAVIRQLLDIDPDAVVRTAIAYYKGRDDFERQKDGALS